MAEVVGAVAVLVSDVVPVDGAVVWPVVTVVVVPVAPPHAQRATAAIRELASTPNRMRRCSAPPSSDPARKPANIPYLQRPPGTHIEDRPRRKVDWELLACAFRGHALIGTDAAELREQDGIFARDQAPLRWHRCLRCDSWLALEMPPNPARHHPPDRVEISLPLRGKALRDKIVLRLIAFDRAFHFVILALLGIALLAFAGHQTSLKDTYYRVLTDLQGGVAGGPVQVSGHVGVLRELDRLFSLHSGTLRGVGVALLGYALLEGIEAVGLWYTKRWAEYLTFLATAILLPLEIYEIIHRRSGLKIVGFVINVAVVIYLLLAKRLFGLRGGGAADRAERERDMNWEAIEQTTPPAVLPSAGGAGIA